MSFREWEEVFLEEIADDVTVGFVGSMSKEYCEMGIPFLRSLNVEKLKIDFNNMKYITSQFHEKLRKSKLNPGDVVIVRTGKPGACSVIPTWLKEANCSDLVIIRTGASLNPYFLAYYVNTVATGHVNAHLVGAVQQHFNVSSAKKMRIKLPSLDEQNEIVKTLFCLDEKIEVNNQINKTLEKMAQAIFKQWFVDFEFPNEDGEPYQSSGGEMVESELGLVPKGWEVAELKEIAKDIVTGKTPSTKEKVNFNGKIPFVKIPDMHGNTYIINTESHLSEVGAVANKIVPKNSVIVSCIATPGLVSLASEDCQTNQQINTIICEKDNMCYYVYFLLKNMADYIRTLGSSGSTTLNLNKGQFSKIKAIIPSSLFIEKFHGLVNPTFETILNNQEMNIKLIDIRDEFLPKLLTGRIRVPIEKKINELL